MKIKRILLPVGAIALFGIFAGLMTKSIPGQKEIKQVNAAADLTIGTDAEFANFISEVNNGTRFENELIQLSADVSYEITAKPTAVDPWSIFAGVFDGLNHTINIAVNTTASTPSLFRNLGNDDFLNAVFKNVNINYSVKQSMTADKICAAPVATYNNGLIQNVHTSMDFNVSGVTYVAGIVEMNKNIGIIDNCTVEGSIKAKGYVAGIACENLGKITNCENNCAIETVTGAYAGGIVAINGTSGFVKATITNCINNGNITSTGTDLGGIAGFMYSNSEMSYCSNYGNISSTSTATGCGYGGLIGRMNGGDSNTGHATKVQYNYNAGNVSSVRNCGGLIGMVNSTLKPAIEITGNLTTGDIDGTTQYAGTLIGWANSNTLNITESFAVGKKLGVTLAGIGAGTAVSTASSLADGVSEEFKEVIKGVREYNCQAISGFSALYSGLSEDEVTLLNELNYYDDLDTYAMKTYGQAAQYIIGDPVYGAKVSLLDIHKLDNSMIVIAIISLVGLPVLLMLIVRRKRYVSNK